MTSTVEQSGPGQGEESVQTTNRGRPLRGVASQSYNVVRPLSCFNQHVDVRTMRLQTKYMLQASAWEQTAILTSGQEHAIELLTAECSQRPIPEHVSCAWLFYALLLACIATDPGIQLACHGCSGHKNRH